MNQDYIFFYALCLLTIFFIGYSFFNDRKYNVGNDEFWKQYINTEYINNLSHDEDEWYYFGSPTCVAYGDWTDEKQICPRHETVCQWESNSFPDPSLQAALIHEAIQNGGQHKDCPLIYLGAD